MKRYVLPLVALIILVMTGCTRPEFEIEVELSSSLSKVYTLTYYTSNKKKGWISDATLSVDNGKGKVMCYTRRPTVVWISSPGPIGVMAFWAERGDKIKISGDSGDPLEWHIGGNKVNEEWSEWRKENLAALRSGNAEKINAAVGKYVKSHSDSQLAALLMLTTYYRKDDEKGFAELWNMIPSKVKSEELLGAAGRADLLTAAPIDPPVKVGPFKLHCEGDTILTVNPGAADVSLLYFWVGDEPERAPAIDSLKGIVRETHEGRLLDVTDIALSQDSMGWLVKIKSDSVGNSKWRRGWAPGGRMYSGISMFALPASPWFVVLNRKGEQIYTGGKLKDAMKITREQLRKAPRRVTTKADTVKGGDK